MSEAAAGTRGDLRAFVLIAYALYLLALVNGVTLIAGVVLLYVKRDEARGTLWDGHFRNLIGVFWVCLIVAALVTAATLSTVFYALVATNGNPPPPLVGGLFVALPLMGVAGVGLLVWYLYRTIGGFARALDGRAY